MSKTEYIIRKLIENYMYRSYLSNYVHFLSPFQVITILNVQKQLRIAREDWN